MGGEWSEKKGVGLLVVVVVVVGSFSSCGYYIGSVLLVWNSL